ncbi:LysE family translocator [Motiliproteus coralliicola]|uniref:LysE family translocator n=1 Tax=Motiliproteus coralliicola TaxID=2283196 RepID=A0A369WSK2_9GAMM|nr:LysE family translocator [Motiliproteus coralliicola]RDE22455.1 LysE family translocator [Motiliproteus coralliicola]
MTLTVWLSLVAICCLGAMSPGPSLVVVLRHSLGNGRSHGILTSICHGTGVAIWAVLTIWGLGLLVTETPLLYTALTYAGAGYLAWMGVKALRAKQNSALQVEGKKSALAEAARDGIMISLLNPKLAIFFLALFSQFVTADQSTTDQLIMIATVFSIDTLWYIIVALIISHPRVLRSLEKRATTINRATGLVLIGLALRVVTL